MRVPCELKKKYTHEKDSFILIINGISIDTNNEFVYKRRA